MEKKKKKDKYKTENELYRIKRFIHKKKKKNADKTFTFCLGIFFFNV